MFATLNPLEKDSMATCYRTTWKITSAVALERPIVYALVPDPAAGTAQCLQETSRFSSEPLTAPYCRCWVSRRCCRGWFQKVGIHQSTNGNGTCDAGNFCKGLLLN
ncbi:uncharacterized protein LOC111247245 [Varroa destructor]|uniref:Uncharacterized protein n=1 Tax=Varroa destructor TaxID=109461 RepID=A0A7M7JMX7_VARDE|nr:uncharacterized protein LOC111247245 [Varroa destructor]